MKYFNRQLSSAINRAVSTFPALAVVGPRQSGKTTLLKKMFAGKAQFVSMEKPDNRLWVKEDPKGFLNNFQYPLIIDEFQYVPELMPYIKEIIDNNRQAGMFYLTGSQQFSVMKNLSESLAGRAAVMTLLPFSSSEAKEDIFKSWEDWFFHLTENKVIQSGRKTGPAIIQGFYPEIISNPEVDRDIWFSSYVQTYLERDLQGLYDIGNLDTFYQFLTLAAARCGSILNYSSFASDLGVSIPTVKKWFSILEASFIIFKLQPYSRNIGKRIIKSPKYYFIDTGLAAYLAGINNPDYLVRGNTAGQFFENFVISEFYKNKKHFNSNLNIYYINYRNLWEIDLLIEKNMELIPVEVKLSATIGPVHLKNFDKLRALVKTSGSNYLVCNSPEIITRRNTLITSWLNL